MRLLLPLLVFAGSLFAQTEVDPKIAKVDALFATSTSQTPGYAIAVIRDGKTILAKGYGMADLERNVPITPRSVFDIGSTSKQFTASAILLLEAEGKLSIDDDVRTYVPELRQYERPITIRHLLHHTSGIRDYLEVMGLSGLNFSNDYSDEETLAFIAKQKALNFAPGEEHLYSNSGYYLLSRIVERASGMSLRRYTQERIFKPLGMTSTHYHDDPTEIVKNRAIGYRPARDGFAIDMSNYHVTGDGAVYTTVEDLAKWDANFYDPKVGGKTLIDALLRRGKLASGEELDYASGLMHTKYKGLPVVAHGGAWAGYRAEMARFPEQRFAVIVLSNLANSDPTGMARRIAEIYLEPKEPAKGEPKAAAAEAKPYPAPAAAELQKLVGTYFERKQGFYRSVEVRDDGNLWYARGGMNASLLRAVGPARFEMVGTPVPAFVTFTSDGMTVETEGSKPVKLVRVEIVTPTADELNAYAGEYASDEVFGRHRLKVVDGKLVGRAGYDREEVPLRPRERDVFDGAGMVLRFERDANGKVTGYTVSAGRVKGIRFTRV